MHWAVVVDLEDFDGSRGHDSSHGGCIAARPLLAQSGGSIINAASMLSYFGGGIVPAYSASKGGVVQLTKTLACEWAHLGIRVNAVAPWVTWTPLLRDAVEGPGKEDQRASLARAERATPLGRAAQPEEMASAIAFFAMPTSSYVTGQCLAVDGGLLAEGFAGPCVSRGE